MKIGLLYSTHEGEVEHRAESQVTDNDNKDV